MARRSENGNLARWGGEGRHGERSSKGGASTRGCGHPGLCCHVTSPLAGSEAKLARAIEHLEPLEHQCERFLKTKPYSVSAEFEPAAREYIVRFRIRKAMPLATAVIVGEVIHDLRSALEHVVWSLAATRAVNVAAPWEPRTRERIAFPVAKTGDAFNNASVRPFIGDEAMEVLSEFQPFTRWKEAEIAAHPLAHLHDLWNVDKHRVLIGAAGTVDLAPVTFRPGALSFQELAKGTDIERFPVERLEDGSPLARVRFKGAHQPGTTEIQVQGEPSVTIEFRGGERVVTVDALGLLCAFVADVLNAFRPLFPRP